MRIDKFICDTVNITRTQAKTKIRQGTVTADGKTVLSPALQVDEKNCRVTLDGRALTYQRYVYIMMNKPKGVISASTDRRCKTAVDLLDSADRHGDLFIAGRLDKDTTGFLLITNDGELAHRILAPKSHIFKTYIVTLEKPVSKSYCDEFEKGIVLGDGFVCKSAKYTQIDDNHCKLEICEGKYHQIKRMFAALGNAVTELSRVALDDVLLDPSLEFGMYRHLTHSELEIFINKIDKKDPLTKKDVSF